QLIAANAELRELFERERAQVACIGGGPGSDLLGVLKHVQRADNEPRLKFFLYDREESWSESWRDVDDKVGRNIASPVERFDITIPGTWKGKAKYLSSDLFTMIYFASEIHRCRKEAEPFFEHLFATAKPGALFLYVDNARPEFYGWFDQIWQKSGVKRIKTVD